MAEKQGLNGAYYGPAIPPTQRYHRPGRGSDCGCCCLVTFLLKVIITVLTLIGLFILIVWLIFRPINKVKFHVTDVALSEFNYTNNMLRYNLSFNVNIRNPNKKIGIYYNRVEAKAFYEGQRFGYSSLTPFYQGHKNTTVLNVVFSGTQPVTLQGEELTQFNSEKANGLYSITLELSLRVKFKLGKVKTARFKPKVECDDLKIRLNGPSVAGSNKCDIKF
ncbi:PREDICTED: protein YLS9-like [Populus euphratica]|uniref:Protein YLS9-like n=1 Tax=Populus euphratica TaxID=75702 RepID=A0AAJ6TT30_POPEU|nr:PREDICTED: protein YLS9-like [Populus euphratica]